MKKSSLRLLSQSFETEELTSSRPGTCLLVLQGHVNKYILYFISYLFVNYYRTYISPIIGSKKDY